MSTTDRDPRASSELPFLVAFSHVDGIGPRRVDLLRKRFGGLRQAWRAPPAALESLLPRDVRARFLELRARLDPDAAMRALRDCGALPLPRADPRYPAALRDADRPPELLYLQGRAEALVAPAVAIVGTRRASDYGLGVAERFAAALVAEGYCVVSGLALGIDGAAHRAALDAGGLTVAVQGCGPDRVYPRRHERLHARIRARGAVLTEYPPGSPPRREHFPARNRIVSGLALAVLVVEAGGRSGALVTARMAADQGRDVWAVPGPIDSPGSEGCHRLLSQGAGLAHRPAQLLEALDALRERAAPELKAALPEDPVEARVRARLDERPRHADELGRDTGLSASEVARALSLLELRGCARHLGGMLWVGEDEGRTARGDRNVEDEEERDGDS